MDTLIVTAGVIRNGRKILIAERYDKLDEKYKWEFPGGKLEENEKVKECLIREIHEELALNITVGDIFEVVHHKYPDKNVLILCYLAKSTDKKAKAIECTDFKWIDISEIDNYEFVQADKVIVNKIKKYKEEIFNF